MARKAKKTVSENGTTLVAKGAHIKGDILFQGSLEVEGEITGNLVGKEGEDTVVRILDAGSVNGELRVPVIFISGKVSGDVYASQQIELAANAVVDGDVHYNVLEVERGAQVNGNFVQKKPGEVQRVVLPIGAQVAE